VTRLKLDSRDGIILVNIVFVSFHHFLQLPLCVLVLSHNSVHVQLLTSGLPLRVNVNFFLLHNRIVLGVLIIVTLAGLCIVVPFDLFGGGLISIKLGVLGD